MSTTTARIAHEAQEWLADVDRRLNEAYATAREHMACRIGCTECCIGPFAITALDALRLRRGLARLEREDPERADAVRARALRACSRLAEDFAGDAARGWLGEDEAREARAAERHADEPCPALDPATGACDLYEARPLSCRTFGPPIRIADESLPPCRLCFTGAAAAHVERCRVEPDPDGREIALLSRCEEEGLPRSETYVAFALVQWDPGGWNEDE